MEKPRVIPQGTVLAFMLLTALFFSWGLPNNLTDTMLAAFKRIMSLSDSRTAWIQVVCYLLGYGCFAVPAALFIKKYSYKKGVMLGLCMYAAGAFLFWPAMLCLSISVGLSFGMYLFAIFILFAGLSILETSANSYVCAIGTEETATRRLNLAQSFNPVGSITGVVISQIFILSKLNTLTAAERAALHPDELERIQGAELNVVSMTYIAVGLVMVAILIAIFLARMPNLKESGQRIDFAGTFRRLKRNRNYVWSVAAQFFYVGAQIAVWSFVIRYAMQQLKFDEAIAALGQHPSPESIIAQLRNMEPIAAGFYNFCEQIRLDVMLPRTAEQAGATYYILSLVLFVVMRFVCTGVMRYVKPWNLLAILSIAAVACCMATIYVEGRVGVYALIGISGCMSLMFPTIYGMGIAGLGEDTKIGGAGMVMAIAGAALLTQIQGIVSDTTASIEVAYWVPAVAFIVIAYYSLFICKK
ncbi:MAG: L-fucose:H+ symporter permease [Bacteroidales bacterium]|jgi:FHS family L-fucose permease-like MFS transporter|nr:L-fucose:H+ symporter permease [Bacteroidales bacterium]